MSDAADDTASIIDLMGSEYGWSADAIMDMPIDQTAQLVHAIMHRRGVRVFLKNPETDGTRQSLADRVRSIFEVIDKPA